jgi:hypothetical protein
VEERPVAADPQAINVSEVVGVGPEGGKLIPDLVRAILRTVLPDTWFAVGGTGSVMPVFNGKQWFLVVYNEDATAATKIQALVTTMKIT